MLLKVDSRKKENLEDFFTKQKAYTYKKGEIIIRVDYTPDGVYYIEKGYIKVYSLTEIGEENVFFIYKPGEIFPILWLLTERDNHFFFEAVDKAVLRKARKEDFFNFLKESPDEAVSFMRYLAGIIENFYERINNLELTNSYPRIISRLIFLARRLGREENGKITFDFPMPQKDIANSINVTRETASKEINKLSRLGIIKYKSRSILVINNLSKLEKELLLHYERKSI